jgi:23S rRNA pseudouridine955/2504/2580 synthase
VLELRVSADAAGQRLDKFVRRALRDVPLSHVFKMLRTRKVRVNGQRGRGEQLLAEGDLVAIRGDKDQLLGPPEAAPGRAPAGSRAGPRFSVLHQDEAILAVNKPSGLAAHPGTGIQGTTLVEEARAYLGATEEPAPGEFRPSPAHRLDRETSGVVLVARTRKAMVRLTEIFTDGREVRKTYLALCKGKMPRDAGTIDIPLSEHEQTAKSKEQRGVNFQEAITHYKVVSSMKEASLLSVRIETGRTHQIRRHLQAAGHPVAGDRRYGDFHFNRQAKQRWGLSRMFLHAWKLSLPHPSGGGPLALEAPLPEDLRAVLQRMNLASPPARSSAGGPASGAPAHLGPR